MRIVVPARIIELMSLRMLSPRTFKLHSNCHYADRRETVVDGKEREAATIDLLFLLEQTKRDGFALPDSSCKSPIHRATMIPRAKLV